MNAEVMVLNVLYFEKNGKKGSRLSVIFTDPKSFSRDGKFLGYTQADLFYDYDIRNVIPVEVIGKKCSAILIERSNPSDPLKTFRTIGTLEHDGKNYSLL